MAQQNKTPTQQPAPKRQHGLFYNLIWGWPWKLIGIVIASLLLSLLIEYAGIVFLWPDEGAAHSLRVMNTELGYLSSGFTRSLLLSEPSITVVRWINTAYQWAFVNSGFMDWVKNQYQVQALSGNEMARTLNAWSGWLAGYLREYLLATVYVTVITLVRVTILMLSVPLFIMVVIVAVVEGLGRRDLRRFGAGYESSFLYHHAKRLVKPAFYFPCMLYLSWPTSIYPNFLLLPAALLLGTAITVTTASFKKYI
ncbi:TIGR03747 family integrating conjugative element membrane protein [Dickeya fangzhongdai]|uniref:TIGR03747 family integrating conjugative element membrane protein n=1 Tax=Dickeya fangzhongdai TaxID=1778540 RepID=A0A2K8QUU9_9GAMM|nr:TIGR03747 family integrating conjugative element membrane protein [Dickeya fangzhongdai]ATZ96540.1 TIGR03747 family integrating conjugative element membrane protein [Dickeya fangzhongdai]QOH49982.1 TIGR03747 family integrating conjugative element membrane protein [Dickeya fangzhongdai]QOH54286.1 TIGR03747 family integrating conjugative element membrane protein [Dickeya fangzhongdai]GGB97617.1 integrating conjugative element membrane protein [Dickeya fangzhongdai]